MDSNPNRDGANAPEAGASSGAPTPGIPNPGAPNPDAPNPGASKPDAGGHADFRFRRSLDGLPWGVVRLPVGEGETARGVVEQSFYREGGGPDRATVRLWAVTPIAGGGFKGDFLGTAEAPKLIDRLRSDEFPCAGVLVDMGVQFGEGSGRAIGAPGRNAVTDPTSNVRP